MIDVSNEEGIRDLGNISIGCDGLGSRCSRLLVMVSQFWEPAAHVSEHARSGSRQCVARAKKNGWETTLNGGLKDTEKADAFFGERRFASGSPSPLTSCVARFSLF